MTLMLKGSKALVLVLLVSFLAVTSVSSQTPHYWKFVREHIDFPQTNAGPEYCNTMMRQRLMTTPCKQTNSFVHISRDDMNNICNWRGGTYYRRNLRISKVEVPVTTCFLQSTAPNRCFYDFHRGRRFIMITCDKKGWPDLFEETNFM
ncbi:angiogenin-2-like [Heteronotia binoei]|uniref:angiogenin-2-like n=1 Tax=Heteronotia binoei TaxID=13085 RepID=UPI00292F5509|nr:angiogenin-2-like [Heteronotia binoei]